VTSQQPRAFFALDLGSATTSAALIGHVGGRWRLIGHRAAPSSVDPATLVANLLGKIHLADSEILSELGARSPVDVETLAASWPRFVASTAPPRRIAVLAGSRRQRIRLEAVALRSGWRVVGGSTDDTNAIDLARLVYSTETHAVLLGADRAPSGDDRRNLPDLAAMVAAATRSRPELTVVLAGGAAAYESIFFEPNFAATGRTGAAQTSAAPEPVAATGIEPRNQVPEPAGDTADRSPDQQAAQSKAAAEPGDSESGDIDASSVGEVLVEVEVEGEGEAAVPATDVAAEGAAEVTAAIPDAARPADESAIAAVEPPVAHVLLAPDAEAGTPAGASLQQVLEGLRAEPNDSRLNIARSIASLAYVLDRSIEVVEVGLQGGLMGRSEPFGHGHFSLVSSHACLVEGSFAPAETSDEVIDELTAWLTTAMDRHRLTDRLNDLRVAPWGNADGDGAAFRLAAAKAALSRLVAAVPEIGERPMPELLVAAGGILTSLPASVVALGLADIVRRSGITQLASDPARVLGPIGIIEDEGERRRLLANLADDILLPLGSLVVPAGVRPGKSAGHLKLKGTTYVSEIELHPGAIQVVDLPGARSATAELEFRDAVRLGTRGHHFSMDVTGGLVGLLIDLRDVPMRISDRPESRRAALEAWQKGMWPEVEE
jgi:hypothetical protein